MRIKISIASVFIWMGFVCAISFMEAWLKFRAPGITLTLGLGIGRLVFNALNKVEWVSMLSIILALFPFRGFGGKDKIVLTALLMLLIVQTLWLLPALDLRAEQHISNRVVPESSNLHFYYVIAECVKVILLLCTGIRLFSRLKKDI